MVFFYLHDLTAITNSCKKVSRGERTNHLSTESRDPAICTEIFDLSACLKKNFRLWTLISFRDKMVAFSYELLLDLKTYFFLFHWLRYSPTYFQKTSRQQKCKAHSMIPCFIIFRCYSSKYPKYLYFLLRNACSNRDLWRWDPAQKSQPGTSQPALGWTVTNK